MTQLTIDVGPPAGVNPAGMRPAGASPGGPVRLDRTAPQPASAPDLDPQQRAVVEHRDGHLLVLAGPGTGKTTTLAELIVGRLRATGGDRLAAGQVLALTFGRRAARELSERISRRLGGGPVPVVSTFHSFAYGVLRQHADPLAFISPPRLLTAAEQDARVRELLTYSIAEGRLAWPESLAGAVGTRGIAEQVRALMARARGQGLGGRDLARFGREGKVPAWVAVGRFFEEYLDTLDFEGSMDYAELIHRAVALAGKEREGRALREAYRLVVVDEYQDTDPAQVLLLRELARGGAQVVAVGDPDQAIYGFRGADVRGILTFPEQFADATGSPARIEVLRTTRRFPTPIARAAQGVLGPVPLGPLPAEMQRLHRAPSAVDAPAVVGARTYPSAAAEAAGVAEILLRAHAGAAGRDPVPWSQMAVLVRNPAVHGPVLARAMRIAGIPVALPPDELALADEPAVQLLLAVVGLALDPDSMPPDTARMLLAGPLGRVDAVEIRALARAVLLAHRAGDAGAAGDGEDTPGVPTGLDVPAGSDALLTAALARGSLGAVEEGIPGAARAGFERLARVVGVVRDALEAGQPVSDVLWAAWSAADWPERLRSASLRGGVDAGAADRDLDAVVALFELANRLPAQRRGRVGLAAFLADVRALRLPQETRTPAPAERDAVRLMSAHRAKGLEWDVVVVASVQEGEWPDLRLRSDLLRVGELGRHGRVPAQTHGEVLAEERRLMYVACTRARSVLVVTAVAEPVDGGAQPSRFLADLGVPVQREGIRPRAPMSAPALVTALRAAAEAPHVVGADGSPDADVEALRAAAVARLGALADLAAGSDLGGSSGPLAGADPRRWWGVRPWTGGLPDGSGVPGPAGEPEPLVAAPAGAPPPGAPAAPAPLVVRLSPSAVEALRTCPLQWFLEKRVRAGHLAGGAAAVGTVVHAVAEALARGEVEPDAAAIAPLVDAIWASMPFPARYQKDNERRRVDEMVAALLDWHRGSGRRVAAAEAQFELAVPTGWAEVRVSGKVDRIDAAPDGRLHLVDFKTGRSAATQAATDEHPQLGIYQLAVREGAVAVAGPRGSDGPDEWGALGGAELVHLGDRYADGRPKVRVQHPLDPDGATWVHEVVRDAAQLAVGPHYPARPNGRCATCAFRTMCPAQSRQHADRPEVGP